MRSDVEWRGIFAPMNRQAAKKEMKAQYHEDV